MLGLRTITGNSTNLLARRPFFVFWFMGQIYRFELFLFLVLKVTHNFGSALSLWQCDNTLVVALDVCKALLPAIDYLTALWPCPGNMFYHHRRRFHTQKSIRATMSLRKPSQKVGRCLLFCWCQPCPSFKSHSPRSGFASGSCVNYRPPLFGPFGSCRSSSW
jgi:hypothetical protein